MAIHYTTSHRCSRVNIYHTVVPPFLFYLFSLSSFSFLQSHSGLHSFFLYLYKSNVCCTKYNLVLILSLSFLYGFVSLFFAISCNISQHSFSVADTVSSKLKVCCHNSISTNFCSRVLEVVRIIQ